MPGGFKFVRFTLQADHRPAAGCFVAHHFIQRGAAAAIAEGRLTKDFDLPRITHVRRINVAEFNPLLLRRVVFNTETRSQVVVFHTAINGDTVRLNAR
ncbi:hypothetical protein D3C86_1972490 [compost metagenome]